MLPSTARRLSRLLLIAFVFAWLPGAPTRATQFSAPGYDTTSPAQMPPVTQAVVTPLSPALALEIGVAPDPVPVGDAATISVTVTNRSSYPAEDVTVTAPTPDGALAVPGPGTVSPTQGWRWTPGHLDANASIVLTGQLRLVRMPAGDALVATAQATARDMILPATATGGALAIDRAHGPATASFTPGIATHLRSSDGHVTVQFPAYAASRTLMLRHARTPLPGTGLPPAWVRGRAGLGTFFLDATDMLSATVHQFNQPLTISISYTPEQLRARGLAEADLTLFWFDSTQQRWVPLPTQIDSASRTASAQVDHFTPFQLSDGSSPSSTFIPSLQGFQVSSFTGAANYTIPIETPAGPAGIKPSLGLSYSSAASDGNGGERKLWQAGWVGKGWSLDAGGYVAWNRSIVGAGWDNASLVFGGQSFDVVKGQPLTGYSFSDTDPTHWSWHAVDENFTRVRAGSDGSGQIWQAWTKDGTRYDFMQRLWSHDEQGDYVYKWLLTRVTDTHANSITYGYQVDTVSGTIYNPTSFLQSISWGYDGPNATGTAHYQVFFTAASRWAALPAGGSTAAADVDWEYPYAPVQTWKAATPHEAYRLDAIDVKSWPSGASDYQPVAHYTLNYADSGQSLWTDLASTTGGVPDGQRVLTLISVQRSGSDGTTLPATTFTYGTTRGADIVVPDAGWNRLLTIGNGEGGRITFTYEHMWTSTPGDCYCFYRNYYRVQQALRQDISGQGYAKSILTTYSYTAPSLNDEAHAATVVYAHYPPSGNGDSKPYLARQEKKEFRGHATVTTRTYDGGTTGDALLQETQDWFYQGDASCQPRLLLLYNGTHGVDESDSCFQSMVRNEGWKGRAFQSETHDAAGVVLQRTTHSFARVDLPFWGSDANTAGPSNNYKRVGVWRSFNYESQSVVSTLGTDQTASSKTTQYFYNASCTADTATTVTAGYGNQGCVLEYDQSGALARKTLRYYVALADTSNYLVDRMWGEAIYNGAGGLMALSHMFYNAGSRPDSVSALGELRRVDKYYDLPASCCTNPIHSQDTTYTYSSFGNRITETTYASAGSYTPSSDTWSTPGSGSHARTTTTGYDSVFNAFPTSIADALGNVTRADYDFHMGTLIRVTGPNGPTTPTDCRVPSFSIPTTEESTCAQYDVFGRMTALIKPGDSTSAPTVQATYHDVDTPLVLPIRYEVKRKDSSADGARTIQQFYDGLGRQVQAKSESQDSAQNIIVDTLYDGLGHTLQQSQPRYVAQSGVAFSSYTSPGGPLYNPTTTTYDLLGRPLTITAPDTAIKTEHHYGVSNGLTYDDVIDPNHHRTQWDYDSLGRLVQVYEIAGTCADYWAAYACPGGGTDPNYWAIYSLTSYAYNTLDLLTSVTDANGNVTTIRYDSLGRKSNTVDMTGPAMRDPDMGDWNYSYDANGNLTSQVDARNQQICLFYDDLDRLIGKHYQGSGACPAARASGDIFYNYDEAAAVNGKGHRTSMSNPQATTSWKYDVAGARPTKPIPASPRCRRRHARSTGPTTAPTRWQR